MAGLGAFELGKIPMPGATITTAGLKLEFEGGHDKRGRYIVKSAIVHRPELPVEEINDEHIAEDGDGLASEIMENN